MNIRQCVKVFVSLVIASNLLMHNAAAFNQSLELDYLPPQGSWPRAFPGLVPEPEPFELLVKAICGTQDQINAILEKSGEQTQLIAAAWRSAGQITFPGIVIPAVLLINPTTTSWTLVENLAPNVFCITALGPALRPNSQWNSQKAVHKN